MKLYLASGHYIGTQAEAKKVDRGFRQVDVPTDKDGLIGYLNALSSAANIAAAVSRPAEEAPAPLIVETKPEVADAMKLSRSDDDLIHVILESEGSRLGRFAEAVCDRIRELTGSIGR